MRRHLAQFVVHQRQEFFGGVTVAFVDCLQNAGHIAHAKILPQPNRAAIKRLL
jgi:hypothetical protein